MYSRAIFFNSSPHHHATSNLFNVEIYFGKESESDGRNMPKSILIDRLTLLEQGGSNFCINLCTSVIKNKTKRVYV